MSTIPTIGPTGTARAYVAPSADRVLGDGEKLDQLFRRNVEQPFVLQRVAEDVWWVAVRHFSTLFHVGARTVMLFDPLENAHDELAAAVATVTDKPVGAVLYSHFHVDHIGDGARWRESAATDGWVLEIVASAQSAAKLDAARSALARPDTLVDWPRGSFTHEGLTVELHGFEWAAHTEDHAAWLLPDRGVLHAPDLVNPDEPPFWRFAANERFLFTEDNLRAALDLDWRTICGGHGNVGDPSDLEFALRYIGDLREACRAAMEVHPRASFADPAAGSHTAWLAAFLATVAGAATELLRPEYGRLYGFEAATRANAEMLTFHHLQYR